jgi:hypothetical protein
MFRDDPESPDAPAPAVAQRRLAMLTRRIGRWIEPPPCHDPSCGDCEQCAKRAPLSGQVFGDLREAARTLAGASFFQSEVDELRDRLYAARRADLLARLEAHVADRRDHVSR